VHRDVKAVIGEFPCARPADTAAGTGDQRLPRADIATEGFVLCHVLLLPVGRGHGPRSRIHDRLIRTGLSQLCDPHPPRSSPLAAAHAYQNALDQLIYDTGLAA
jgi:hypothetical protein